ncbi:MAG TPA: hypothetical protein VJ483_09670 [Holophagaceae bacterium]|nr:hypothetical protein [Holophagaceae bacterium]
MKSALRALLLLTGCMGCRADDVSGPNHATLIRTAWGSIFYDPVTLGAHQLDVKPNDIRIRSARGEVKVLGSEANDFRLTFEREVLTIKGDVLNLDIRWHDKAWSLRSQYGRFTLASNAPPDTVTFERSGNTFTIKGAKGFMTATSNFGTLSIKSSAGNATVTYDLGNRTFSGVPLDQLPYLGRGVFISFHGLGILIDMAKLFPMQELGEWIEWRPILGRPFE